jgi:hypothetical protein
MLGGASNDSLKSFRNREDVRDVVDEFKITPKTQLKDQEPQNITTQFLKHKRTSEHKRNSPEEREEVTIQTRDTTRTIPDPLKQPLQQSRSSYGQIKQQ